jgi:hypothetical protein
MQGLLQAFYTNPEKELEKRALWTQSNYISSGEGWQDMGASVDDRRPYPIRLVHDFIC